MPITPFLDGQAFDRETTRVMGLAFEVARVALRLADQDPTEAILAKRIIELARSGERNPDLLSERVLFEFGQRSGSNKQWSHQIDQTTARD